MEELMIHKFEAEQIEDTLRIVANILGSRKIETQTCADRQVMKSIKMIKRVLAKEPYKQHDIEFIICYYVLRIQPLIKTEDEKFN